MKPALIVVVLSLATVGCGGSDGPPPPGRPGTPGTEPATTPGTPTADPDPDSFGNGTISATLDGVAFVFQENSQVELGRSAISFDAGNVNRIANFAIGLDANRGGTFDCGSRDAGATMGGVINRGLWIAARNESGSQCTVTLSEVAEVVGQHWRGTFSGSLVNSAGGPNMQLTNGAFDYVRTR
jgi:hypothetical protein